MPLSGEDIKRAFAALSAELAGGKEKQPAQIAVAGGAALVLLFHARETTKDVDAFFIRPAPPRIREAAVRISRALGLPEDWLNDGAKGYFVVVSEGEVLFESESLIVRAVSTEQLLAMKIAAWRDALDRGDAQLLLSKLQGSHDEIWARVAPFIAHDYIEKATSAFHDLWD